VNPVMDITDRAMARRCRITHSFRYRYSGPVTNVRQRLMVFPPAHVGRQRLLKRSIDVSLDHDLQWARDAHGNTAVWIVVPKVEEEISFLTSFEVALGESASTTLEPSVFYNARWRRSTPLTFASEEMRSIARGLVRGSRSTIESAERIASFAHERIRYEKGATNVRTTASEALALGAGVCQDHAHLMISLCRCVGIPARYVSGHLQGEGSSHAWAQVLCATDGATDVVEFDPCNNRRPHAGYVTVAIGRDYGDVAPTSGSYVGRHEGVLHCGKTVEPV
jgi:transglutaminase-like putative cysteine protease